MDYNNKSFADALGIKAVELWKLGAEVKDYQDGKKPKRFLPLLDNKVTGQDLYDEQIQKQETIIQRDKIRQ